MSAPGLDAASRAPGDGGALPWTDIDVAALVCFSHLRWSWVWQRPQHLLSRLARTLPVVVVEEPLPAEDDVPGLAVTTDRGVTVLTPLLPGATTGFGDEANPAIRALVAGYLGKRLGGSSSSDAPRVALWYYTPMALGAEPPGIEPALVVYDAMDDLASFRFAPAGLREREAALLARADLVFAGGPSLYRARRDRHPAVHCLPSGVEPAHFAQAATGVPRPPDISSLPRPILGFYGVLDERLDLDLLTAVADARPAWTVALIGPVIKVAEEDLPRRPNIAYLGPRPYAELPAYLAAFDVALLPFARNEATRSISPTKTLEYLAGEKPLVSTPIRDVVDLYGPAVAVAGTAEEFVAACERLLAEPAADRIRRLTAARTLIAGGDWDAIAERVRRLMTATLDARYAPAVAGAAAD